MVRVAIIKFGKNKEYYQCFTYKYAITEPMGCIQL